MAKKVDPHLMDHIKVMLRNEPEGQSFNLLPRQEAEKAATNAWAARRRLVPPKSGFMPPVEKTIGAFAKSVGNAARKVAAGAGQNIEAMQMINSPKILNDFMQGKKSKGPKA